MSHSDSKHCRWEQKTAPEELGERSNVSVLTRPFQVDEAIDAALRNVPLPNGLLERLNGLVAELPEEAAERADWLGC